jgi:protein-S-isoprenylcysteine O-methyltransferase Ste14
MALIIWLSLFGFSGFLALDLPLLRKQHLLRNLLSIAACLALVTALWITPPSLAILPSAWHTYGGYAGSALIAIAVVLLAYSIFIEIPLQLRASRARQPAPSEPDAHNQVQLVVKGTYALCRHPGYLWLSILLVGYIFIEDNLNAILIATTWSVLNLLLVTVQDRFIFPNTFKDYVTYQKKTPFLIPTSSSIIKAFEGPEA